MRNYFLLLPFLLISYFSYSQKEFKFDHVVEYKTIDKVHKKTYNTYWFLNSKDKDVLFTVWEGKNDYNMMVSLADGTYYYGTIVKEDFFVEAISLRCPYSGKKNVPKLTDYKYERKKDTLINTSSYGHFVMTPLNKKEIKKHNLLPLHYLTENKLELDFLSVKPNDLLFQMIKEGYDLPNGLITMVYSLSNTPETQMELVQSVPIKKYIFVDTNCK